MLYLCHIIVGKTMAETVGIGCYFLCYW